MSFLDVKIKKFEFDGIKEKLTSWGKASNILDELSEDELKKYIYVEVMSLCRFSMVQRLKGRFNKLRNIRENQEIMNNSEKDKM